MIFYLIAFRTFENIIVQIQNKNNVSIKADGKHEMFRRQSIAIASQDQTMLREQLYATCRAFVLIIFSFQLETESTTVPFWIKNLKCCRIKIIHPFNELEFDQMIEE